MRSLESLGQFEGRARPLLVGAADWPERRAHRGAALAARGWRCRRPATRRGLLHRGGQLGDAAAAWPAALHDPEQVASESRAVALPGGRAARPPRRLAGRGGALRRGGPLAARGGRGAGGGGRQPPGAAPSRTGAAASPHSRRSCRRRCNDPRGRRSYRQNESAAGLPQGLLAVRRRTRRGDAAPARHGAPRGEGRALHRRRAGDVLDGGRGARAEAAPRPSGRARPPRASCRTGC